MTYTCLGLETYLYSLIPTWVLVLVLALVLVLVLVLTDPYAGSRPKEEQSELKLATDPRHASAAGNLWL